MRLARAPTHAHLLKLPRINTVVGPFASLTAGSCLLLQPTIKKKKIFVKSAIPGCFCLDEIVSAFLASGFAAGPAVTPETDLPPTLLPETARCTFSRGDCAGGLDGEGSGNSGMSDIQ